MKKNATLQDYFPITDIQKGIIFDTLRSEYASPPYIVQTIFHLKCKIFQTAFLKAFAKVVNRHEQLRSAFHYAQSDCDYLQYIYRNIDTPCANYDYMHMTQAERENSFTLFLSNDLTNQFDLSQPPLMRLAVFKFDNDDFRIIWTRHHILLGGESVKIIVAEIFSLYQDILLGKKTKLQKLSNYSETQKYLLEFNEDNDKIFWQEFFSNLSNPAYLPAIIVEKNNAKVFGITELEILNNEYLQLRKFITCYQLTMNTLLEAAWAITLSHYSNNQHIIFGSVRAYPRDMVKNCVGLFINTLPVSINIDTSNTILCFLQKIKEKNKQLREHIFTPLTKIKEWCQLSAEQSIYQSVVDFKPESLDAFIKKKFSKLPISIELRLNIPYPITLEVINEADLLKVKLHYDCSLFTAGYATSILNHFTYVLNSFPQCPNSVIADLPAVLMEDWVKIQSWNNTEQSFPINNTLHKLLEKQTIKTPTAKALVYRNEYLTYQELNNRANQLAFDLIKRGVQIETHVAICLQSGIDMVVAILAVLKAGGIYVPVDANYPVERVNLLINDSQPKIIITDTQRINLFTNKNCDNPSAHLSLYNMDEIIWLDDIIENPAICMLPSNGMYVIYTSGSTGVPKGVVVEHRSAINMAFSCINTFQITCQARILQIASFSFDVFVAEWCMALLAGAALYFMDKTVFSPEVIVQELKNHQISTIILTSTILSVLPMEDVPSLKVIACGGEPCSATIVNFWAENRLFLNIFGVTEASVCSTAAVFKSEGCNPMLIGKPLANTQIYILNDNQAILPVGVPGEMCIGGIGLAKQYHNNPLLTHEKFISKMLSISNKRVEYTRLYRTGDLARWLPDGQLEFIGRKDDQVKIRGFRIETGEIERTLEKYPLIVKAIVLVKPLLNDKQLCGYLFPVDKDINLLEVKHFLREQLPSYMVPSTLILIDHVPLTPNGKIDKEKLLAIENYTELPVTSELTRQDKIIVEVTKAILNIKNIPLDLNFLDLGFDSISLIKFSSTLSQALNTKITVIDLFTYTTIQDLSNYLSNLKNQNQ